MPLKQNGMGNFGVSKKEEESKLNFKKAFKGQQAGMTSTARKLAQRQWVE